MPPVSRCKEFALSHDDAVDFGCLLVGDADDPGGQRFIRVVRLAYRYVGDIPALHLSHAIHIMNALYCPSRYRRGYDIEGIGKFQVLVCEVFGALHIQERRVHGDEDADTQRQQRDDGDEEGARPPQVTE